MKSIAFVTMAFLPATFVAVSSQQFSLRHALPVMSSFLFSACGIQSPASFNMK
jgi:hypothetical protein